MKKKKIQNTPPKTNKQKHGHINICKNVQKTRDV